MDAAVFADHLFEPARGQLFNHGISRCGNVQESRANAAHLAHLSDLAVDVMYALPSKLCLTDRRMVPPSES